MNEVTKHKDGAESVLNFDSLIVSFEARGTLTICAASEMAASAVRELDGARPCGAVFIYKDAQLGATFWELFTVLAGFADALAPSSTPAALVVSADLYQAAREYCANQREAGIMRAAFTDVGQAKAWASEQAALVMMQREHRERTKRR